MVLEILLMCTALDEAWMWYIYEFDSRMDLLPIFFSLSRFWSVSLELHAISIQCISSSVRNIWKSRVFQRLMMENLFAYKLKPIIKVYTQNFSTFAESQIIYSCMSAHHSSHFFFVRPLVRAFVYVCSPDRSYMQIKLFSATDESSKKNIIQQIPITKTPKNTCRQYCAFGWLPIIVMA